MNPRLFRSATTAVVATFALALSGCVEVNETAGDVGDVVKGKQTVYATDGLVTSVKSQVDKDAGLAAADRLGYIPVAYIVDENNGNVELVMKVCADGLEGSACMNKVPSTFEQPDIVLHLNSEPQNDIVSPNGHYALRYPGVGGRHGGITCEAKPGDTTTGLTQGVVGDFVAIGSAVDKQFAKATDGASQAVNLASGEFNCTTTAV